jgi:hypothetical protein
MVLDIQTVHHILKNTAVQNVNKPFVYIMDLTSTLIYTCPVRYCLVYYLLILFTYLFTEPGVLEETPNLRHSVDKLFSHSQGNWYKLFF